MKEAKIVDYAMPLMKVERFAKRVYDLCLQEKYEEAQEQVTFLITEARILKTTLQHMKEQACRSQSPTASA